MKHIRIAIEATITLGGGRSILPSDQLCGEHIVAQLFRDLDIPGEPTRSRRIAQGRCIGCGRKL